MFNGIFTIVFLFVVLILFVTVFAFYFIIKKAVKNGVLEAYDIIQEENDRI